MQYEFNDYKRLTRGYLRDYSMWKNAIEAWEKEKADIDKELASVPIAISKYGGEPGGGNGEMNSVECLAERRIKLNERVLTIEQDTRELLRVMKNIKTAIDSLDDETGHIIILHLRAGQKSSSPCPARHPPPHAHRQHFPEQSLNIFIVRFFFQKIKLKRAPLRYSLIIRVVNFTNS